MGQPAARVGDMHACPAHGGGAILSGQADVLIGGMPAARVTDQALCPRSPPDAIAEGEATVLIGGRPAVRMGDRTVHGGVVVSGCTTVWIGANAGRCLAEAAQSGAAFVSAMED
ncbi:PAAR repeat-containing protein [Delftia sp. 670]|nr:PAAR repeat-containing protein [Delftia sp. 670]